MIGAGVFYLVLCCIIAVLIYIYPRWDARIHAQQQARTTTGTHKQGK